jgi:hypothetical protein
LANLSFTENLKVKCEGVGMKGEKRQEMNIYGGKKEAGDMQDLGRDIAIQDSFNKI